MKTKTLLPALLVIYFLYLLYLSSQLSISYIEAESFLSKNNFISGLSNFFTSILSKNDITYRLPNIFFTILSSLLLYHILGFYKFKKKDKLLSLAVFLFIPGNISAALILNYSAFMIFSTFLFIYLYKKNYKNTSYILLFGLSFLDYHYELLFLSLVIYAIYKKKKELLILNILFFILNLYIFGEHINGIPSGHFLDTVGVYSAIFSPFLFVFIVYALYRKFLEKDLDIVWFVPSISFILSILLSFRQRIDIEYIAPFVMPSLIISALVFKHSYYTKIKPYRKKYKIILTLIISTIAVNLFVITFHKTIYLYLENPKKHFVYDFDIAKELAKNIKSLNIHCVDTDYKLSKRLKFYDIQRCEKYRLTQYKINNFSKNVTVSYKNKTLFKAYVTKINK